MSVVNNKYVPVALGLLQIPLDQLGPVIVDALLNDVPIASFAVVEIDSKGRSIALAHSEEKTRPVGDSSGNVRLFSSADTAITLGKRSNLPAGSPMAYIKAERATNIGDPVASLKTKHKAAKTEANNASNSLIKLSQKQAAALSLGWGTAAAGSAELAEFEDIAARVAAVSEWSQTSSTRLQTLTDALIAASIDPVTYMPLPPAPPVQPEQGGGR